MIKYRLNSFKNLCWFDGKGTWGVKFEILHKVWYNYSELLTIFFLREPKKAVKFCLNNLTYFVNDLVDKKTHN